MNRSRLFPEVLSRAAAATFLAGTFLCLGGCSALEGALLGGWFGAILGESAPAVVTGAIVGAGVGAVIESHEAGYWYHDGNCQPQVRYAR